MADRQERLPAGGADDATGRDEAATGDPVRRAGKAVRRAVHGAGEVVESVMSAGESTLGELTQPAVRRVRPKMGAATRRWRNRNAARMARLRRLNREPLPKLFDVRPEARLAPIRELGLMEIPVSEIVGTAVEGPDQRGRDFLPPPALRTGNWVARWQRIRSAVDRLATLPPIEVLKAGGKYWVVDGHNRVAAALYANQVAIDALVTAVRLPGEPIEVPGSLASMLGQPDEFQPGGATRFTLGPSLGSAGPAPDAIEEEATSSQEDRGSPGGDESPTNAGGARVSAAESAGSRAGHDTDPAQPDRATDGGAVERAVRPEPPGSAG